MNSELLRPLFTRLFLFMYLLGIVSSMITAPGGDLSRMYSNAPWELLVDVYLLTVLIRLVPQGWIRRIVKGMVYVFMYALYVIDTFCYIKFKTAIAPSILLLVGETNAGETTEFLSSYVTASLLASPLMWVFGIMILHLSCVALWHVGKKKQWKWVVVYSGLLEKKPRLSRRLATNSAVAVAVVCLAIFYWWDNKSLFIDTMQSETIGQVEHKLAISPRMVDYQPPMRLAFSIRCNQLIGQQLYRLRDVTERNLVDSCDVKSPEIVLIIGESFNRRHAQLYGYEKENMPRQMMLMKRGFLTRFDDVVTPWNLTSFAFKHLMTTYCVGDSMDWCDYPLFCQLFRQAGYEVTFLTNQFLQQTKEEIFDFSGGFFLNDEVLSPAQFDRRNQTLHQFDEGLLADYDSLPKSNKPRLTIFHLYGMHLSYNARYPRQRMKWGSNDYPGYEDLTTKQRKVMSHYDNAVLYNDSVVYQIVRRFKKREAIVIYVPDHGEEVFGPGMRHHYGRIHDNNITARLAEEEFHIPMWIYCSQLYVTRHRNIYKAIKAAKNKPFMTDALAHMLLGLAGIHTPYYNESRDLLSPKYDTSRPRPLKHLKDYNELIQKNKK